jgi:hypothetical protein
MNDSNERRDAVLARLNSSVALTNLSAVASVSAMFDNFDDNARTCVDFSTHNSQRR